MNQHGDCLGAGVLEDWLELEAMVPQEAMSTAIQGGRPRALGVVAPSPCGERPLELPSPRRIDNV